MYTVQLRKRCRYHDGSKQTVRYNTELSLDTECRTVTASVIFEYSDLISSRIVIDVPLYYTSLSLVIVNSIGPRAKGLVFMD